MISLFERHEIESPISRDNPLYHMLGHTQESGNMRRVDYGQYFLACDWSKPSILDCDWFAVEGVSAMFEPDNHEEMFY